MSELLLELKSLAVRPAPESPLLKVDLRLASGRVTVLRGPSGCGKTTLLRCVTRLRPPEAGEVLLRGVSWHAVPPREWRRRIGYVPSGPALLPGTVRENLELAFRLRIVKSRSYPATQARELAERLRLPSALAERETRLLSDGERARIGLLRTLLTEPEVLLADEPTAPLDPDSRGAVASVLRERAAHGTAVLLVAHDEELAANLDADVFDLTGWMS
jgi:ABC-type multidrug transport system ATPase subunit